MYAWKDTNDFTISCPVIEYPNTDDGRSHDELGECIGNLGFGGMHNHGDIYLFRRRRDQKKRAGKNELGRTSLEERAAKDELLRTSC